MHAHTSAFANTSVLNSFDYNPRTRVVFGCGSMQRLGELARDYGGSRVLLVTDAGLAAAGHPQRAQQSLEAAGLAVALFDNVHPNPTTRDVDACVRFAQQADVDLIVGLGGGSSMDCAKGANFLLTNGGSMRDYQGVGRAHAEMLPMIAVPTTAGTGSEAQSFALIADPETHMKMACGDPRAACRVAVLDPELTLTQPQSVAAATGIDAVTHAIESFVCTRRNEVSQLFARQAWSLLGRNLAAVFAEPDNLRTRGAVQWGAHLAGASIENSMLGAAHAMANPLTAHFGTTHGFAVGLLLPHVIRFNADVAASEYAELAALVGASDAAGLADFVTGLLQALRLPQRLSETRFDPALIPTLAEEAIGQWTRQFNPRTIDSAADFEQLYRRAM